MKIRSIGNDDDGVVVEEQPAVRVNGSAEPGLVVFVPVHQIGRDGRRRCADQHISEDECLFVRGLRCQGRVAILGFHEVHHPTGRRSLDVVVADDRTRGTILQLTPHCADAHRAEMVVLVGDAIGLRIALVLPIAAWIAVAVEIVTAYDGIDLDPVPPRVATAGPVVETQSAVRQDVVADNQVLHGSCVNARRESIERRAASIFRSELVAAEPILNLKVRDFDVAGKRRLLAGARGDLHDAKVLNGAAASCRRPVVVHVRTRRRILPRYDGELPRRTWHARNPNPFRRRAARRNQEFLVVRRRLVVDEHVVAGPELVPRDRSNRCVWLVRSDVVVQSASRSSKKRKAERGGR